MQERAASNISLLRTASRRGIGLMKWGQAVDKHLVAMAVFGG